MTSENLFWKIIRNKVIFKTILNLLKFDIKQKFEYSTICRSSIDWLILNGYNKTLKHKIINNDCHKLYLNSPYNGTNKLFELLFSLKEYTNVELFQSIISIYPIHFQLNLENIIMVSIKSGNLTSLQVFTRHYNYQFKIQEFSYALTIGEFEISKFIICQLNITTSTTTTTTNNNNNNNNNKSIEKEVWTRVTKEFRVKEKFIINQHEMKSDIQKKVENINSLNQFINYLFEEFSFKSPIKSQNNKLDIEKYSLICYNCPFELDVSVKWLLSSCYTIMYLELLGSKKKDNSNLSKKELDEMKFTDNELSITLNQLSIFDGGDDNVLSNIKKLIKYYLKVRLIVNGSHSLVYWLKFGDDETIQTFNQIKIDHGVNDIMAFKYGDYNILEKWFKHSDKLSETGYLFKTTTNNFLTNTYKSSKLSFLFEFCSNDIEKQKLFITNLCNDLNSKLTISSLIVNPISFFSMVLVNDNLELVKLTFSLLKQLLNNKNHSVNTQFDVYKYIKSPLVLEFIYNIQLKHKDEYFKFKFENNDSGGFEWISNGRINLFETFHSLNLKNGISTTEKLIISIESINETFTKITHENYLKFIKYAISNKDYFTIDIDLFKNIIINSISEQHESKVKEIILKLSMTSMFWYPLFLIREIRKFNPCIINILEWMIDNNKVEKFNFEIAYYVTGKLDYLFNNEIPVFTSNLNRWYNEPIQINDIKVILMILDKLMKDTLVYSSNIKHILNGLFENGYLDSLISIKERYPPLFYQNQQQYSIFDNETITQFIDIVIHNDNIELIPFLNQCYPNLLKQYRIPPIDHKTTCYAYIKKYINTNDHDGFFFS